MFLNMKRPMLTAALASCAVFGSALAGDATPPADGAATANALRAAIDPKTGKLRVPTAAEIRRLQFTAKTTARGAMLTQPRTEAEAIAQSRRLKDGTTAIRVPTDRFSSLVLTRGDDGALSVSEQTGTTLQYPTTADETDSSKGVVK